MLNLNLKYFCDIRIEKNLEQISHQFIVNLSQNIILQKLTYKTTYLT